MLDRLMSAARFDAATRVRRGDYQAMQLLRPFSQALAQPSERSELPLKLGVVDERDRIADLFGRIAHDDLRMCDAAECRIDPSSHPAREQSPVVRLVPAADAFSRSLTDSYVAAGNPQRLLRRVRSTFTGRVG
jgi:hypothetical protein